VYDEANTALKEKTQGLTAHWKSVNKQSFTGSEGPPGQLSPNQRDDMPQVKQPEEPEPEREVNVMELARNHAQKTGSSARPRTMHNNRMRPKADIGPRPESREGQNLLRGAHRGGVMGTSQSSRQIPGYSGFIAKSDINEHALSHGFGKDTRASLKETLFDCYRKVLPGYTGFQPASVHNVRTFDVPLVTTYGAQNHSMVELGRDLKRPEVSQRGRVTDCVNFEARNALVMCVAWAGWRRVAHPQGDVPGPPGGATIRQWSHERTVLLPEHPAIRGPPSHPLRIEDTHDGMQVRIDECGMHGRQWSQFTTQILERHSCCLVSSSLTFTDMPNSKAAIAVLVLLWHTFRRHRPVLESIGFGLLAC